MNFMLMKKIVGIRRGLVCLVVLLFDFQYIQFQARIMYKTRKSTSNLMPYYGFKQKNYSSVS